MTTKGGILMNKDYILDFERYLEELTDEEYEVLVEKACKIAMNILIKEKQLTS